MADRKDVRKFFEFKLINDAVVRKTPNPIAGIILLAGGAAAGWILQGTALSIVLAIVGFGIGYGVVYVIERLDYKKRSKERDENHKEFTALLDNACAVMGADLIKAFLRVFERTQIDRQHLRILEKGFSSPTERDLLSEETIEEKLGDLMEKSVRLVSRGDISKARERIVLRGGQNIFLFNPMRLIVLFLTETQMVICDVQLDSIDGNLKEEIQRISLPKIVNIHFTAERKRLSWSKDEIVQSAKDLNYPAENIKEMESALDSSEHKDSDRNWIFEEMTSSLIVTRTDSGGLRLPMRTHIYFGKHKSALDDDELTRDEITVDRMINELNRLVEHAK
jgi:hypothetical protein